MFDVDFNNCVYDRLGIVCLDFIKVLFKFLGYEFIIRKIFFIKLMIIFVIIIIIDSVFFSN